jgi:membrane protein
LLNLLGVLAQLYEHQQDGRTLSRACLARHGWGLDEEGWAAVIDFLEGERLVSATGSGDWVLCRDLSRLSLHQLLERCPWPLPTLASLPERLPDGVPTLWYPRLRDALQALEAQRATQLGGSLAQWLAGERATE